MDKNQDKYQDKNPDERTRQILDLAKQVLNTAKNSLVINLRFMDSAISRLRPLPLEVDSMETDGESIAYNSEFLLKSFMENKNLPVRQYLHMVMHCVFQHFVGGGKLMDKRLWDIACDIAVENAINELDIPCVDNGRKNMQKDAITKLQKNPNLKRITAEHLYRFLLDGNVDEDYIKTLEKLFKIDDHDSWYEPQSIAQRAGIVNLPDNEADDSNNGDGIGSFSRLNNLATDWKNVSERMQMDMETFSKKYGTGGGSLIQNLREVNREKYDYASFLKKFAVMGEAMKLNNDEFDYIFYTYGLDMYGKMPLIEPLEYKEVKRIKEFVIAIDTSGSTSGELVQSFLQKTYNILLQTENFFTKINLHIIQCDADIQEDCKITSPEEFNEYIKTMKLRGMGGTDFRPVFDYVNELIYNKEFTNLKGLIYFTDGCGAFPNKQPDYETAFVFIDDDYNNYNVPVWAMKLILQKEDI